MLWRFLPSRRRYSTSARRRVVYQADEKYVDDVVPSEGRDLLLFVFKKKQQMPLYAQHDRCLFPSTCEIKA